MPDANILSILGAKARSNPYCIRYLRNQRRAHALSNLKGAEDVIRSC